MSTIQDFVDGLRQASSICCLEEEEPEPYKNKYHAADLLKKLLGERAICSDEPVQCTDSKYSQPISSAAHLEQQASASDSPEEVSSSTAVQNTALPAETDVAAAAARIRCGLILLETDLLADGESSIQGGLPILEKDPEAYLAWLLESYNALGALYSDRGNLPVALEWLGRAEDLYQKITGTGTKHAHLALPIAGIVTTEEGAQHESISQQTQKHQHQQDERQLENLESVRAVASDAGMQAAEVTLFAAQPQPEAGEYVREGLEEPLKELSVSGITVAEGSVMATAPEPQMGSASLKVRQCSEHSTATTATSEPYVPTHQPTDVSEVQTKEETGGPAVRASEAGAGATSPLPLAAQLPDNGAEAVQLQYTKTLYYLAQVHGHMKSSDRSALYCAATLYRQLASGRYDLDDWVNNCLQLGGYYAKVHAFGLAMYCHAAAQSVVDRDTGAGAVLGEDIAANLKLATARVYNMRLAASHAKYVEAKELEMHYPDVSYFPDYLRFSGLSVPSPDTFPWGMAALAKDFEAARDLLNTGMPFFKAALLYYQLDGWVTDHVGIIMDMSNMYRCLAGFEADPTRAAAMHRCRAQLLEPLSGALNPDHYPGLSRSIDLELAHVYREISDVRELQGGQASKVSAAAASAAKYYQRFLRSFSNPETGAMPDRVDSDNEPYFLMASFGLGRMLHRMRGSPAQGGPAKMEGSFESLVIAAHKHLHWTAEYVNRYGLDGWMREAQAAEELSELLVEQMRLRAMAAAHRVS